jgi:hypothetical protein
MEHRPRQDHPVRNLDVRGMRHVFTGIFSKKWGPVMQVTDLKSVDALLGAEEMM